MLIIYRNREHGPECRAFYVSLRELHKPGRVLVRRPGRTREWQDQDGMAGAVGGRKRVRPAKNCLAAGVDRMAVPPLDGHCRRGKQRGGGREQYHWTHWSSGRRPGLGEQREDDSDADCGPATPTATYSPSQPRQPPLARPRP